MTLAEALLAKLHEDLPWYERVEAALNRALWAGGYRGKLVVVKVPGLRP